MKRGYSRFFERLDASGKVMDYIYIDPAKGTMPTRSGQRMFNDTVAFNMEKARRGQQEGSAAGFPVVFDDFTVLPPYTLKEITLRDVPPAVKAKYTRWEKYQ